MKRCYVTVYANKTRGEYHKHANLAAFSTFNGTPILAVTNEYGQAVFEWEEGSYLFEIQVFPKIIISNPRTWKPYGKPIRHFIGMYNDGDSFSLDMDLDIHNVPSPSTSTPRYQDHYQEELKERQREAQRREEEIRKERLENWYSEYVIIDVYFDYHYIDREYNNDYWERRYKEIRVTRREAMALIQAGESAIIGKLGYSNWGQIRNVSYQVPFGLYNRPGNC